MRSTASVRSGYPPSVFGPSTELLRHPFLCHGLLKGGIELRALACEPAAAQTMKLLLDRTHRDELDSIPVHDRLNLLTGRQAQLSRIAFGMTTWNLGETVTVSMRPPSIRIVYCDKYIDA